jgi:Peptidase_C39 like family
MTWLDELLLLGTDYGLPRVLHERKASSAEFIRNDGKNVFLRLKLESGGFIDLLIDSHDSLSLASIGTGSGEVVELKKRYSSYFLGNIDVQDAQRAERYFHEVGFLFSESIGEVFSKKSLILKDAPTCEDIVYEPQEYNWCVPACMSMLSRRIYGTYRDQKDLAAQWHENPSQPFDPAGPMYADFKRQFRTYDGSVFNHLPYRRYSDFFGLLRGPTILSLFSENHAEVCVAVSSSQYYVLNPGLPGETWHSRNGCILLQFTARAPGPPCKAP